MKNFLCNKIFLLVVVGAILSGSSPHKFADNKMLKVKAPNLVIHFNPVVKSDPLIFGKEYMSRSHEAFTVQRLKFYVGKIRMRYLVERTRPKAWEEDDNYFLVDFSDSSTTSIKIFMTPGEYDAFSFLLGVDSLHNSSGAQSGALDPAKGMFWTWNSGYVAFKFEGISPISNGPAHAITYHIGGYRKPNNVSSRINLNSSTKKILIEDGRLSQINITVDISALFQGPYPISIKKIRKSDY